VRRALALFACVLLAGCGGSGDDERPDLEPAPAGVARDVRAMFRDYTAAMGRQDFAGACRHLTAPSIEQLAAQARQGPLDCPSLLGVLHDGAEAREALDTIVRTLRIEGVDATARRDTVLLSWSAEVDGERVAVEQPVLRDGGRWKLVSAPTAG
jgi:hypothetical protein